MKNIVTIWKMPREATCAVADASSAAQYANASWSDTFTRLPASCCRAGERPMPHAFAR